MALGMLGSALLAAGGNIGGQLLAGHFSAKEASKNRDFQERMANTQYTRAAHDLQQAGLNRVLALGSPGAVPGGAQGIMPGSSPGSAAVEAASAVQGISQSKAQERYVDEQARKIFQEARSAKTDADKNEVIRSFYDAVLPLADNLKTWAETNLSGDIDVESLIRESVSSAVRGMFSAGKGFGSALYSEVKSALNDLIEKFSNPASFFD